MDVGLLEFCVREDLNRRAPRVMAVLRPLKVVLENYPDDHVEDMDVVNNPEDPSAGTRRVPFSRELYIEQDDFREDPPKKFFRLAPGREVRLRNAYFITCRERRQGRVPAAIVELRCTYDPATRGGDAPDGRKVKATLHWVSAPHAVDGRGAALRPAVQRRDARQRRRGLPGTGSTRRRSRSSHGCKLEPSLAAAPPGRRFQFERLGYFCRRSRIARPARRSSTAPSRSRTAGAKIEQG